MTVTEKENHVVFFSGGLGSYATALRVIEKHGTDNLSLLFTDTLIEDQDLYRFIIETAGHFFNTDKDKVAKLAERALNIAKTEEDQHKRKDELEQLRLDSNETIPQLIWLSDHKDPWDIFFHQKYLGNSRIAQCSHLIKQVLSKKYIKKNFDPENTTLYLGIDWTEEHRTKAPTKNWLPYKVEFPMCEEPYVNKIDIVKELVKANIDVPRLYAMNFAHNNCLQGEEKFITFDGVKTFKETVGQKVKVLGEGGNWQDANIQSFGVQEIWNLTVKKGLQTKIIKTTKDHRWFKQNSKIREMKLTRELAPGDTLSHMHPKSHSSVKPSPLYNTKDGWVVESVEPAGYEEEVFCAVVPNGHAFTLEGYIFTLNCGGFCVRAGQGHFANLLEQNRPLYLYHEMREQEIRELIGKDVAMMRKQKKGVRFSYTLKDLRIDLEGGNNEEVDMTDIGGCGCFVTEEEEAMEAVQ